MITKESPSENKNVRPTLDEKEVTSNLLRLAREKADKEILKDGQTRHQAIAERFKVWMKNEGLLTFTYEPTNKDPNVRVATLHIKGREVGKLIIHHYPLTQRRSMMDSLRGVFRKPLPQFRETFQFINNQHRSFLLEDTDGAIPTDSNHHIAKWDSYLPEDDTFTTSSPFFSHFFEFIIRLHEQGHAYRFGLMTPEEQQVFIADQSHTYMVGQGTAIQVKEEADTARQERIVREEVVASTAALLRINDILEFLGVGEEEFPLDLVSDIYSEAVLDRLPA